MKRDATTFGIEREQLEDEELDAIEDRTNAATGGPWVDVVDIWSDYHSVNSPQIGVATTCGGASRPGSSADAKFIAHARSDIPALVAEVRRLRAAGLESVNTQGAETS